jgi:hypothetical protein
VGRVVGLHTWRWLMMRNLLVCVTLPVSELCSHYCAFGTSFPVMGPSLEVYKGNVSWVGHVQTYLSASQCSSVFRSLSHLPVAE